MRLSGRRYCRSGYSQTAGGGLKIWTCPDASSPQPCEESSRQPIRAPWSWSAGRRSSSRSSMIGRGAWWRRLLPMAVCRSPLRSFEISFEKPPKASPRPLAGSARLRRRYFVTSRARGASLKAPTVTHALLLMIAHDAGHPAAYTYCPYEEDWVDRMTEATRRQLQQPRFSPIAARRLLKSQKWTDS